MELVELINELAHNEEFGPNTCLSCSSSYSHHKKSPEFEMTSQLTAPSIWRHGMIQMDLGEDFLNPLIVFQLLFLENRLPWPPSGQGITFSTWIRVSSDHLSTESKSNLSSSIVSSSSFF